MNNTYRIFKILEILVKYTNENKPLNTNQIIDHLNNKYDIYVERKTVYSDIKTLINLGYNIEKTNKGYYIYDYFFNINEIKILLDALMDINFLDTDFINKIKDKLYNFIDFENQKLLKKYDFINHKKVDDKLKYYIAIIIDSLIKNTSLIMEENIIFPHHLHRNNNKYYLIYQYENNNKIYFKRIDRIKNLNYSDKVKNSEVNKDLIIKILKNQINMYQDEFIRITIKLKNLKLIELFYDEFENINKVSDDLFVVNGYDNKLFYSKLLLFKNDIEILKPSNLKENYLNYLKDIITA